LDLLYADRLLWRGNLVYCTCMGGIRSYVQFMHVHDTINAFFCPCAFRGTRVMGAVFIGGEKKKTEHCRKRGHVTHVKTRCRGRNCSRVMPSPGGELYLSASWHVPWPADLHLCRSWAHHFHKKASSGPVTSRQAAVLTSKGETLAEIQLIFLSLSWLNRTALP
jgi:hypothetical protein